MAAKKTTKCINDSGEIIKPVNNVLLFKNQIKITGEYIIFKQ